MTFNEKLEADLSEFLSNTWMTQAELMPYIFRSTPPWSILRKGQTLEKLWRRVGIPSEIIEQHLKPAIKYIDANKLVQSNPYYQRVKPQKAKFKDLELTYSKYSEQEIDVIEQEYLTDDYRIQIPIAVHTKVFKALSLSQDKKTWMSITPNEILSMQPHVDRAHGKVLTAGLGLGYFAYMCAFKENVETVTVIEGNPNLIEFFKQRILPQFEHHIQNKINIISSDYYDYIKDHNIKQMFDFAFIDIHYGGADAPEVYCLSEEVLYSYEGSCVIHYWLEEGVHLKMQMGLAMALYNKFIAKLDEEMALHVLWKICAQEERTFQLFAKIHGWVYRNVYTLGTSEEAFRLIFDDSRYKQLGAYTR